MVFTGAALDAFKIELPVLKQLMELTRHLEKKATTVRVTGTLTKPVAVPVPFRKLPAEAVTFFGNVFRKVPGLDRRMR